MKKPSSFDIIDKYLQEEYRQVNTGRSQNVFNSYKKNLIINPKYWDKYFELVKDYKFDWREFRYQEVANEVITLEDAVDSDKTGIYLFILKATNLIVDCPKYVIYVGIAGERGSERSLKTRLKDYFNLEKIKKRNRLHSYLCEYYEHTYVMYSPLDITSKELSNLEMNLHGFFCPPAAERDYPTDIKKSIKAW
jgi:hypothetical protein